MAKRVGSPPDPNDEADEDLASLDLASEEGGASEYLVGLSGRPGHDDLDSIPALDDVGDYRGDKDSLPPDYDYRVSATVSDRYGEYPYPDDDDLPLGYTSDDDMASEEGLAYYPPDDPTTPAPGGLGDTVALGPAFSSPSQDTGFEVEDIPRRPHRSDYVIAEDVLDAIASASELTGFRIKLRVKHGVVYLRGYVSTMEDLSIVEDIVGEVPDVIDLDADHLDISDDDIEGVRIVTSPQVVTDGDLEEEL